MPKDAKPLTYVVTARKMHESMVENATGPGQHHAARAVEIMLTIADHDQPNRFGPITLNFIGPECAMASEFPIGARFELRPAELPQLERKIEISP